MTGAVKAAIVDKIRFIRIKDKDRICLHRMKNVLMTIQAKRMTAKEMIKLQLPPNLATLSDMLWPRVIISLGSFKRFSMPSSCS
jgi:hypothetical protein